MVKVLTSALTMNRAMQTATTSSSNVSNVQTLLENQNGSNVHKRTQPENENGSNLHTRTQPQKDEEVSLNASQLWFGNNANVPQDHQGVNGYSQTANPEKNQPVMLNEVQ